MLTGSHTASPAAYALLHLAISSDGDGFTHIPSDGEWLRGVGMSPLCVREQQRRRQRRREDAPVGMNAHGESTTQSQNAHIIRYILVRTKFPPAQADCHSPTRPVLRRMYQDNLRALNPYAHS